MSTLKVISADDASNLARQNNMRQQFQSIALKNDEEEKEELEIPELGPDWQEKHYIFDPVPEDTWDDDSVTDVCSACPTLFDKTNRKVRYSVSIEREREG